LLGFAPLTWDAAHVGTTMRILEDTPDHLKLADRKALWISAVCLGSVMILVGGAIHDCEPRLLITAALFLLFALGFLHAGDVTFDKIQRTCSVRRLAVVRITRIQLGFDDILDARIEVDPLPDNAAAPGCRMSLVTRSAVVPLTVGYESDYEYYSAMRDTVLDAVYDSRPRPAAVDPVRQLASDGHITAAAAILRRREGIDLKTALARVRALQNVS
jgi:hypothetical protein